ncbi:MAG: hypothetical protein WCW13_06190 [archaeon]|jgi:hypothetical protein
MSKKIHYRQAQPGAFGGARKLFRDNPQQIKRKLQQIKLLKRTRNEIISEILSHYWHISAQTHSDFNQRLSAVNNQLRKLQNPSRVVSPTKKPSVSQNFLTPLSSLEIKFKQAEAESQKSAALAQGAVNLKKRFIAAIKAAENRVEKELASTPHYPPESETIRIIELSNQLSAIRKLRSKYNTGI